MKKDQSGPRRAKLWVYSYQISPPPTKRRLREIRVFLQRERLAAQHAAGTWAGRLVRDPQMTRILIVSDSLERSRAVSRRLEEELKQLKVDFAVTEPVVLPDNAVGPSS